MDIEDYVKLRDYVRDIADDVIFQLNIQPRFRQTVYDIAWSAHVEDQDVEDAITKWWHSTSAIIELPNGEQLDDGFHLVNPED